MYNVLISCFGDLSLEDEVIICNEESTLVLIDMGAKIVSENIPTIEDAKSIKKEWEARIQEEVDKASGNYYDDEDWDYEEDDFFD